MSGENGFEDLGLQDSGLFRQQCLIDGAWVGAGNGSGAGATIAVTNPANGQQLGTVPRLGAAETRAAIDAARRAWPAWRALLAKERAALLRTFHDLVLANVEDLARLMTAEQGKPLAEARGEIALAAAYLEWFAEEGRRTPGDIIPTPVHGRRLLVTKEPVGVCAAITPWNFPAAMITRKLAPGLAVGCPFVVKPASATPFSALALAVLAERAGFPPGVINVITGPARDIGAELTASPVVRKLTFTGSTAVGRTLMAQSADTVKKLSLELGGHAPFIVFDDADLDAAVAGAVQSKFRNTGQTCVCANRIYVQEGIHNAFVSKLGAAVAGMKVGSGFEAGVVQGPLIDSAALTRVEAQIADAVARGARIEAGGSRHEKGGLFFQPTILSGVTADMLVTREETFGPLAPVYRFRTEAEAIAAANDTPFGLAAYFYTRDIGRAWRVSEALEYGLVGLNAGVITTVEAPFGGFKESGLGREGSRYGVDEYLELKYICMAGLEA